jgi:methionyl-tRNA synthetase
LRGQAADAIRTYARELETFQVHAALMAVNEFATACNSYIEMTAPWKLAKDAERAETLDHVLYALAEGLRIIAILVSPVLPNSAREIFQQLNWSGAMRFDATDWGGLPDEHKLGKPIPVFPRIESASA